MAKAWVRVASVIPPSAAVEKKALAILWREVMESVSKVSSLPLLAYPV